LPKRTCHYEGDEEHEVKTKAVQNEDCKLQKSKWLTIRGCPDQFAFFNLQLAICIQKHPSVLRVLRGVVFILTSAYI
jgi:hypothetical protein